MADFDALIDAVLQGDANVVGESLEPADAHAIDDIARALERPAVRIEFMGISSYGNEKTSSGQVKVTRDLDVNIENQHVLIVEDIIDSGVTLTYLTRLLEQRHPKSLAIATLLDKPERRIRPVEVKYVGFRIPDEFVVGYGLDFAEDYRNLSDIRVLGGR